jgi:methylenetetrahydrofolate dehydrogenase (NADP+)/methenyltetrahydrofolate cyclohydrolase
MARQPYIVPATARGIIALLDYYNVSIEGKLTTVVGRSRLVGQPIAQLLLHRNATVTTAHRKTLDLASTAKQADILVVVAGHPNLITPDMVKPGAIVIDVGLTKTDHGMQGDVHPEVAEVASSVSPVPCVVGPMTVCCLMQNVVQAATMQANYDSSPS